MDHDDDVEHLFSWLQTPELRYREFAGAREITDTVVSWQARTNAAPPEAVAEATAVAAPHNTQLHEEYPTDQFPDQSQVLVEVEPAPRGGPAMIPPMPSPPLAPPVTQAPSGGASPFALGAEGRPYSRAPAEQPRSQPYLTPQTPPRAPASPPSPAAMPPPAAPPAYQTAPPPAPPAAPPAPVPLPAAPAGARLLGGAYGDAGSNGNGASAAPAQQPTLPEGQQRGERSLDAVFGRLAGRNRLPDPRERLRHIPGLGPPAGRPR